MGNASSGGEGIGCFVVIVFVLLFVTLWEIETLLEEIRDAIRSK